MKRYLIIFSIAFTLFGCAFLQEQKDNFQACLDDTTCKAEAEAWQKRTEAVATVAAAAIPVPGAAAVPKVLGYLALGLSGILLGRTLKKEKPIAS